MPLPKQFLEELPDKTDEQLYFMLGNADDYMPDALEAAKAELGRRGRAVDETILQRYQKDRVMAALQMSGRLPKPARKRGILFLVGGVVGGTIIVTCISFATNSWSYLYSWLSGLAVLVMVFIYSFCKRRLINQAFRHVQTDAGIFTEGNEANQGGEEKAEQWNSLSHEMVRDGQSLNHS